MIIDIHYDDLYMDLLDPNNVPLDPNNVPLDPNNVPLDPNNVPLDPVTTHGDEIHESRSFQPSKYG